MGLGKHAFGDQEARGPLDPHLPVTRYARPGAGSGQKSYGVEGAMDGSMGRGKHAFGDQEARGPLDPHLPVSRFARPGAGSGQKSYRVEEAK
ncbi:hypothetical protein SAMN02745704_00187 [Paucidesulfovibrio gracilis DSM 16080]|uniref:Uncharacterized protein n=1 Tax=Paucidesulfovibrio gracilis DSM 16080 TaxID=1121449 RepID=A0A1T4W306_9BACT|nr:hypothetical protein SAMN02745704_00187 [Paucidesulfovibrio gracilis DSM 16080]